MAEGLSVHKITVSCPDEKCDALNDVPILRTGKEGMIYLPQSGQHKCKVCGKSLGIIGNFVVQKAPY